MVLKDEPEFELTILDSLESYPAREERDGIAAADLITTAAEALEALKATKGASAVMKRLPNLENLTLRLPTAYFSVCQKTGTARYLDMWDTDHFDGFTDMQRCLNDCCSWCSGDGYQFWDPTRQKQAASTATSPPRRQDTTPAMRGCRAFRPAHRQSSNV